MSIKKKLSELEYQKNHILFHGDKESFVLNHQNLPVKIPPSTLEFLEYFKSEFEGSLSIPLSFPWFRAGLKLSDISLLETNPQKFNLMISSINNILADIREDLKKRDLNLEQVKVLIKKYNMQLEDDVINRLLTHLINIHPFIEIKKTINHPLSFLHYRTDGILLSLHDKLVKITQELLPFELGPILEDVKQKLNGEITFFIDQTYYRWWNSEEGEIQSKETDVKVCKLDIDEETLQAFHDLRIQHILNEIQAFLKESSDIDMETVEYILGMWGVGVDNEEVGQEIIKKINPWSVEKVYHVPLKDITYLMNQIVVPIKVGQRLTIQTENLPIKSTPIIESFKGIFEGDISIREIYSYQFGLDFMSRQLTISKSLSSRIAEIEESIRQHFEKMVIIYPRLVKIYRHEFAFRFAEKPFDISDKVPFCNNELEEKGYEPECVRIIEEKAQKVYLTQKDLWFQLNELLVWERPEPGAATYVFCWPQIPLFQFIALIWCYQTLHAIWDDYKKNGYKGRVSHSPGDIETWKGRLDKLLKKGCK